MVVAIYGSWALVWVGGGDLLDGGEQRLDGFVSERQHGGDGAQTGRDRLVATRRADALHDLFAAHFLQIVRRLAGIVGRYALIAERASLITTATSRWHCCLPSRSMTSFRAEGPSV